MMNISGFFTGWFLIKVFGVLVALVGMTVLLMYESRSAAELEARQKAERDARQHAAVAAFVRGEMMQLPSGGFQETPLWGSPTP